MTGAPSWSAWTSTSRSARSWSTRRRPPTTARRAGTRPTGSATRASAYRACWPTRAPASSHRDARASSRLVLCEKGRGDADVVDYGAVGDAGAVGERVRGCAAVVLQVDKDDSTHPAQVSGKQD